MKKHFKNFSGVLAAFALFIGIVTANSACYVLCNQPKEPDLMKKYKF